MLNALNEKNAEAVAKMTNKAAKTYHEWRLLEAVYEEDERKGQVREDILKRKARFHAICECIELLVDGSKEDAMVEAMLAAEDSYGRI